jgi:ribonuclease P protein component
MANISNSYPKSARLITSADFSHVFDKQIARSVDDVFILLAAPSAENRPRVGLAIAKKRAKRAVDRNKLKRVIRESWRLNCQDYGNFDVVVMIKPGAHKHENQVLRDKLSRHWARLERRADAPQKSTS